MMKKEPKHPTTSSFRRFYVVFFALSLLGSFCCSGLTVFGQEIEPYREPAYLKRFEANGNYLRIPEFSLTGNLADGAVSFRETSDFYQFNITLSKKPSGNVFNIPMESSGLTFYLQRPLDEELNPLDYDFLNATHAIRDGVVVVFRPIDVVYSYAVYRNGFSGIGSGKMYHIYRPLLVDAKGKTSWARIEVTKNNLRIVADSKFLESAVYPVVIDPTIGETTVGGTSRDASQLRSCNFTSSYSGTLENGISFYPIGIYVENTNVTCYIFNGTTKALINATLEGSFGTSDDGQWQALQFASDPSIETGLPYILSVWADATMNIASDTTEGDAWYGSASTSYPTAPDPLDGTPAAHTYSLFANVTVVGGESGTSLIADFPSGYAYYVVTPNATCYAIDGSDNSTLVSSSDDDYVIEQAMAAMSANEMLLVNGTFSIDDQLAVPTSGLYIDLYDSVMTKTGLWDAMWYSLVADDVVITSSTEGAVLYGQNVSSPALQYCIRTYYADNITISNLKFMNFSRQQGAVQLNGGVGHTVSNNNFTANWGNYAFVSNQISNSTFEGNYVDAQWAGAGIGFFGDNGTDCSFNVIANNTVKNIADTEGHNWHLLYVSSNPYAEVVNNTFTNSTGYAGASCLIKSPYTDFHNNTVSETISHGFHIYPEPYAPDHSRFYNNTLVGAGISGIYAFYLVGEANNITIANNTISNWHGVARIRGNGAYYTNTTIADNYCHTMKVAVALGAYPASGGTIYTQNTTIENNVFENITGGTGPYATCYIGDDVSGTFFDSNNFTNCVSLSDDPIIDDYSEDILVRSNIGLEDGADPHATWYHLNITASGEGVASPTGLKWQYLSGENESIAWTANDGYSKIDISVNGVNQSSTVSPLNVTLSEDTVVVAYFESTENFYLTVGSATGGVCNYSVGEHVFANGATANVSAVASDGYSFVSWLGVDGTSNPVSFVMSSNRTLAPVFSLDGVPHGGTSWVVDDDDVELEDVLVSDAAEESDFLDFVIEYFWVGVGAVFAVLSAAVFLVHLRDD